MKRRSFFSWGAAGLVALVSGVAVSLGAVVRFLVPSVFYEPPQSFKIGNPADFSFGAADVSGRRKNLCIPRPRQRIRGGQRRLHAPGLHGRALPERRALPLSLPRQCVRRRWQRCSTAPRRRPLEWFEVTLARDGQLRVDKDKTVPASYRLMV